MTWPWVPLRKVREIVRCFKLGVLINSYFHKLARGTQLVSFLLLFFLRRSHFICHHQYFHRWDTPKHRRVPQNGSMLCHTFLCPPSFSELLLSYIVKEESSFPWLRTDSGYGQYGQWLLTVGKYSEGGTSSRDDKWSRAWTRPSRHPSLSSLCPSVRSSMRMDTLQAPRLPAAHHPCAESDTAAFCPPRMGRK